MRCALARAHRCAPRSPLPPPLRPPRDRHRARAQWDANFRGLGTAWPGGGAANFATFYQVPTGSNAVFWAGKLAALPIALRSKAVDAYSGPGDNNKAGLHILNGTDCTPNAASQGGDLYYGAQNPWLTMRITPTTAAGAAAFSGSACLGGVTAARSCAPLPPSSGTHAAIAKRPVALYDATAQRFACAVLAPNTTGSETSAPTRAPTNASPSAPTPAPSGDVAVYTAELAPPRASDVAYVATLASIGSTQDPLVGNVTHTGSVYVYASPATGDMSLIVAVDRSGAAFCGGRSGACGAHVHSGTGCADSAAQGGHQLNPDGTDKWTQKLGRAASADVVRGSGLNQSTSWVLQITGGNARIDGKPFVVHNSAGVRVMCGMLARYVPHDAASQKNGELALFRSGSVLNRAAPSTVAGSGSGRVVGVVRGRPANISSLSAVQIVSGGTCAAPGRNVVLNVSSLATSDTAAPEFLMGAGKAWDSQSDGGGNAAFSRAPVYSAFEALAAGNLVLVKDLSGYVVACGVLVAAAARATYDSRVLGGGTGLNVSGRANVTVVQPEGYTHAFVFVRAQLSAAIGPRCGEQSDAANACGLVIHNGPLAGDCSDIGAPSYAAGAPRGPMRSFYGETASDGSVVVGFAVGGTTPLTTSNVFALNVAAAVGERSGALCGRLNRRGEGSGPAASASSTDAGMDGWTVAALVLGILFGIALLVGLAAVGGFLVWKVVLPSMRGERADAEHVGAPAATGVAKGLASSAAPLPPPPTPRRSTAAASLVLPVPAEAAFVPRTASAFSLVAGRPVSVSAPAADAAALAREATRPVSPVPSGVARASAVPIGASRVVINPYQAAIEMRALSKIHDTVVLPTAEL